MIKRILAEKQRVVLKKFYETIRITASGQLAGGKQPQTTIEFLEATGNQFLLKKLARFSMNDTIPLSLHEKALKLYHTYCLVGGMKSLHQFMHDKHLDLAVRINANLPETTQLRVKTTKGDPVAYTLVSFPLYLAQKIDTLISTGINATL